MVAVLCDYFSAASDDVAATVIDIVGGPSAAPVPGFDTVRLNGIDPADHMATLEELLTEYNYETVLANARQGHAIAMRDDGERLIVALTDELHTALAEASDDELREVAARWPQASEFPADVQSYHLIDVVTALASLASGARARNEHLYCWVCMSPTVTGVNPVTPGP